MLDFKIRSQSIYNPVNFCFEKKETFPLLTYTHLSILRHHPNLYNYANPFERRLLNSMLEQDIISVLSQRQAPTQYVLTPAYLLKTHNIDSMQVDRLMNPSFMLPSVKVMELSEEHMTALKAFLSPLRTGLPIHLQFEIQPFLEEYKSEHYFSEHFFEIQLYSPHHLHYEAGRPSFTPKGHLTQLLVNLLNEGVTSLDVTEEGDEVILHPYLLGKHRSLEKVRLLPE